MDLFDQSSEVLMFYLDMRAADIWLHRGENLYDINQLKKLGSCY